MAKTGSKIETSKRGSTPTFGNSSLGREGSLGMASGPLKDQQDFENGGRLFVFWDREQGRGTIVDGLTRRGRIAGGLTRRGDGEFTSSCPHLSTKV